MMNINLETVTVTVHLKKIYNMCSWTCITEKRIGKWGGCTLAVECLSSMCGFYHWYCKSENNNKRIGKKKDSQILILVILKF